MQWVVKRVAEYHSGSHLPERFQKWVCCSPTDCWHLAIENCQSNSIRAFIFKCRSFAWQNLFQRPSYKFIFPPHAFLYMSSLKKKKRERRQQQQQQLTIQGMDAGWLWRGGEKLYPLTKALRPWWHQVKGLESDQTTFHVAATFHLSWTTSAAGTQPPDLLHCWGKLNCCSLGGQSNKCDSRLQHGTSCSLEVQTTFNKALWKFQGKGKRRTNLSEPTSGCKYFLTVYTRPYIDLKLFSNYLMSSAAILLSECCF